MKKNLLFIFLLFFAFAVNGQLAQKPAELASFHSSKSSIKVFPNPATEYFELNDRTFSVANIQIFNIAGKKMESFSHSNGNKYYLDGYPKGMYFIQMIGNDGKIIRTTRLNVRKP